MKRVWRAVTMQNFQVLQTSLGCNIGSAYDGHNLSEITWSVVQVFSRNRLFLNKRIAWAASFLHKK